MRYDTRKFTDDFVTISTVLTVKHDMHI